MKIVCSFLFSCLFIWLTANLFGDSIAPWVWSPELEQFIHPSGHIHHMRSEGWGTTHLGRYGLAAIPDVTAIQGKKILIRGDSYVEAWQVNDRDKMAQALSRCFHSEGMDNWLAVGRGESGATAADYYFLIPKFERLIEGIEAHVIFFAQPKEDIMPSKPKASHHRFISITRDKFQLVRCSWTPSGIKMKAVLHRLHLDFVWPLAKHLKAKRLRFLPDKQNIGSKEGVSSKTQKTVDQIFLSNTFDFLTSRFRQQTEKPIIFVYGPTLPKIEHDKIAFNDIYKSRIKLFAESCHRHGILFLDLTETFMDFYHRTNKFPRGFINSSPSRGHLNKNGHALVAQRLFQFLIEHNILQP